MPSAHDWFEWYALNRASDVPQSDLLPAMLEAGIERQEILGYETSLQSIPAFRAARKIAEKYRKVTQLCDALITLEALDFNHLSPPRCNNLGEKEFVSQFYSKNLPVIITDVVPSWPAMQKWSLQYFDDNFGKHHVRFQHGRKSDNHRNCFIDHSVEAPFSEFIRLLQEDRPDGDEPPYLIAHDHLLDREPFRPLLDDLQFDRRYHDRESTSGRVFFWLGPTASRTPMHRDFGNVYMAQIIGRKRILLAPAKQIHLMYNESGYHSEVDYRSIDFKHFPLLQRVKLAEVILEPGEMLFIPLGWWHDVESLDTTVTVTGNNFSSPNSFDILDR